MLTQGMLKHSDGYVMKPVQINERGKIEIEFYEEVTQSLNPTVSQLKLFIPRFLGLHQFVNENSGNSSWLYKLDMKIIQSFYFS